MSRTRLGIALALITLAGAAGSSLAQPVSRGFLYQGELRSAGAVYQGLADVRFSLWSAPSAGTLIGTPVEALGMDLTDGRFSVMLNGAGEFGPAAFNGQRRWVEISVRNPNNGGAYEVLSPRQELTVAPYAAYASEAATVGGLTTTQLRDAGSLTGTLPDSRLSNNIPLRGANQTFSGSNTFTGPNFFNNSNNTFLGNGTGLTGLNASNIASGTVADARLSSNVAFRNANQTFTGANTFSALTSFNDRIGVGTLPSGDFRMHLSGGNGQWKGGIAASGASYAVVLGELGGRATIGSNNAAITSWQDLSINPFGGKVMVGGGAQAPAGATLQIGSGTPASLTQASGYLTIGPTGGSNLVFDDASILARSSAGDVARLRLNSGGGNVVVPAIEFDDGTLMTSAARIASLPIVHDVTDPDLVIIPAGGGQEIPLHAPGARVGMGALVTPAGPVLDPGNFIAYVRVSGNNTVMVKIMNQSGSDSAYVNRRWIVTLFPAP